MAVCNDGIAEPQTPEGSVLETDVLVVGSGHMAVDVRDRLTGHACWIRTKHLIGADGACSPVAADIDLPYEGAMDIAGSMNITFRAIGAAKRAAPATTILLGRG